MCAEERMHASGFSGGRRDGAPEREMRGDAGWDEKHEMSWEHYRADIAGRRSGRDSSYGLLTAVGLSVTFWRRDTFRVGVHLI